MSETILDVCDLSVERSGKVVIRDVCLHVTEGDFVGIVGPNGSGKSTLLLAILGVLKPKSGTIHVYGKAPNSKMIKKNIGYVSQAAANLPKNIRITVRELVMLGTINASNMFDRVNRFRNDKVDEAIRITGLDSVKNTEVGRLSGGQKQRAVIARALASEADFIILDEPLDGIDTDSKNSLLKLLDNLCHHEGKTILMVSHDITAIRQTAHRMVFLEETIRFDGTVKSFPGLDKLADLRGIEPVH